MRVLNVHERTLPVARREVGAFLDALASPDDRLWPRHTWPPMRFDRPLGVGARGGHGPIRYDVTEYRPAERVRFRFLGPRGFHGHHTFEVIDAGAAGVILRHTIAMTVTGAARLSWPLIYRPLHDALLEDALAGAEAALGCQATPVPWSPWVRRLRRILARRRTRAKEVAEP